MACDKGSHMTPPSKPNKAVSTPRRLDLSPPVNASTQWTSKPAVAGDHLSMALLAQQLPPLSKFTGDNLDEDSESVSEWLEQTELVAEGCGWNEQAKLFSVVARLRGTASGFYRSCTPQQRSSYTQLSAALRQRFTSVRIQSVQSSKFHGRKQRATETVDQYAQDLRKLFLRAYSSTQREAPGAETMAQSVLAYQFVDGLLPNIKMKLAGSEGTFEELLSKARFQEARLRDVATAERKSVQPKPGVPPPKPMTPAGGDRRNRTATTTNKCFICKGTNHFARQCPMKGRGLPLESRGGNQRSTPRARGDQGRTSEVKMVRPDTLQDTEASESTVDEAVERVMGTMHNIKPSKTPHDVTLGPTPTSQITLDSAPVTALLDTGSPVSIVSLDFYLKAAAQSRKPDQSPVDWGKEVREKLKPTTVSLRSYGGAELEIVSQARCHLERDGYQATTVLQVQTGAPVDLLLGTDTLGQLGFSLTQASKRGPATDLLSQDPQQPDLPGGPNRPATPVLKPTSGSAERDTRVKLIQAACLPACHAKIVRVDVVDQDFEPDTCLFVPERHTLEKRGLAMVDAVVHTGEDQGIKLVIMNRGMEPVKLESGEVLGSLHPASLLEREEDPLYEGPEGPGSGPCVAALQEERDREERLSALMQALSLDKVELPREESDRLQELVLKFAGLFALDNSELGQTSIVTHIIDTGDSPPVRQLPRRIPFSLRGKVHQLVGDMLQQGVIVPSSSPWASPIVLVAKKDGTTRFCVDYRKLNAITKLDVFPLPRIDDSLDLLASTQYFTTLDLASGYWQVGMDRDSQEKTAFTTHAGLYEFTVMPFGLCNAPATFQRLMESVLADLAREKCLVYIDDVLVIGHTFEEHLHNLEEVFARLEKAGLKLKPSKCKLARSEVDFLGYVVSRDGISTDPRKISAIAEYPPPTDLKSLRAFLGLTSYYRRFISSFSSIANPLYALTRKDAPFVWSPDCDTAFHQLKELLTQAPVLAYPSFGKDFLLETDASGVGLGAVLSQKQKDGTIRPLAFASRTLQTHEKNYGISELEALAVVWAVKHFRHYIYGYHCTVFIDHEALKSLLNTPQPSGKLARWGMALQELDLKIEYRPGRANGQADALSRYPVSLQESDCARTQTHPVVAAVGVSQVQAEDGEECAVDPLGEQQQEDPPPQRDH